MRVNDTIHAISIVFLLFSGTVVLGQHSKLQQLQALHTLAANEAPLNHHKKQGYDASFMSSEKRSGVVNVISFPLRGLMYAYQNVVSGQLYGHCMYKTTCSNFSKQCIYHYGFVKGVFLSADRLSRCTNLCFYDYPNYKIHDHQYIIDTPTLYSSH